jgi:hypothetical protein
VNGGVIIGRGANFVLRDVPGALCVLLVGHHEASVRQAMRLTGLNRESAEYQLNTNDEAQLGYVRRHYSRHPDDPTHYHPIIDSTEMNLDAVVGLIAYASEARRRQAVSTNESTYELGCVSSAGVTRVRSGCPLVGEAVEDAEVGRDVAPSTRGRACGAAVPGFQASSWSSDDDSSRCASA